MKNVVLFAVLAACAIALVPQATAREQAPNRARAVKRVPPDTGAALLPIIAAHRDTQFAMLKDVRIGDLIIAETRDGNHTTFRVTSMRVVKADASGLDPTDPGPTGARLALVTCYPFGGVLHSPWRYVVLADLMSSAGRASARATNALKREPATPR